MVGGVGNDFAIVANALRFRVVGHLRNAAFGLFKVSVVLNLTLNARIFGQTSCFRCVGNGGRFHLRHVTVAKNVKIFLRNVQEMF